MYRIATNASLDLLAKRRPEPATGGEEDTETRELVRRFTDASVAADINRLAAMLRDDVRCSMPPTRGLSVGRDAVLSSWVEDGFEAMTGLRAVPTRANRQPALAFYLARPARAPPGRRRALVPVWTGALVPVRSTGDGWPSLMPGVQPFVGGGDGQDGVVGPAGADHLHAEG